MAVSGWPIALLASGLILLVLAIAGRRGGLQQVAWRIDRVARRGEALAGRLRAALLVRIRRDHTARNRRRLYFRLRDYEQWLDARHQDIARLCREIRDSLTELRREVRSTEADYPESPNWVAAVDAVARLPAEHQNRDTVKVLERLAQVARRQHEQTLREFRWAAAVRQRILSRSVPHWQRIRRDTTRIRRLLRKLSQRRDALELPDSARAAVERGMPNTGAGLLLAAVGWLGALVLIGLAGVFTATLLVQALTDHQVGAGFGNMLVGLYIAALVLSGGVLAAALRWLPQPRAITVLAQPWRHYLAAGSAIVLVGLALAGVGERLDRLAADLAMAGWPSLSALLLSATLLLAPLATAFLAPVLLKTLESARPALLLLAWGLAKLGGKVVGALAGQVHRLHGRMVKRDDSAQLLPMGSATRELDTKAAQGQ